MISAEIFEFSKNNVFWNKFIFESTTWLCLGTHLSPVVLVDQKTNILRCLLVRDLQTAFDILERRPGRMLSCTAVTQSKWQPPSKGKEFAPMPRSRIAPGPPGPAHFAHFSTLLLYGRRSKRSFQWEERRKKFCSPFDLVEWNNCLGEPVHELAADCIQWTKALDVCFQFRL